MHIGRLGVQIGRGRFVIEDLRVEGATPDSPPWLTAKRIDISLTWNAIFHREILVRCGRDERLADGGRDLPERHAQLAAAQWPPSAIERAPAAGCRDASVRSRQPRGVRAG